MKFGCSLLKMWKNIKTYVNFKQKNKKEEDIKKNLMMRQEITIQNIKMGDLDV